MNDIIQEYIEYRNKSKEFEEKYRALEVIILNDAKLRNDNRIQIRKGRTTITLKDKAYEMLEMLGVETTKTELKTFKDFEKDIQEAILRNQDYYEEKTGKESIIIKEVKNA